MSSQSSSMRVFLYGYYGQGNLGDELLLRASIGGIVKIRPRVRFVIRSDGASTGVETLGAPVEVADVDRLLSDQSRSKIGRLLGTLWAYRGRLRGCDWFVFGGGTLFHERSSALPLILMFLICLLARTMGVRIAALGVGVAELRSTAARLALRGIVLLSDVFAVRDDAAVEQCRKAGAGRHVRLTGDLAFTLSQALRVGVAPAVVTDRPVTIGISIYPAALQDPVQGRAALVALQSVAATLLSRGWRISLLTFHHDPHKSDALQDRGVLASLVAGIPAEGRSRVTETVLSADGTSLAAAYQAIDLHCGMRFHGHVLAAIFDVPFVGISADNKIDAICRLFNMPVCGVSELSADMLVRAIDASLTVRLAPGIFDDCVRGAQSNFALFADAIERTSKAA